MANLPIANRIDEDVQTCPNPPLIKPKSQCILPQWLLTKENEPIDKQSQRQNYPIKLQKPGKRANQQDRPILNFLKRKVGRECQNLLSYRSV